MEKLQINCPAGYEIDTDKSDLSKGIVYFKESKKYLSYNDVAKELFYHNYEKNNSTTKEQLESILALNMLCNVAKHLNGDWLPKINSSGKHRNYCICFTSNKFVIDDFTYVQHSNVYFKSKELALQAIEILGEETIMKALTLNH